MSIQKFATALLLSVSLIYFCAADCTINKPQDISSSSVVTALPADLSTNEDSKSDNDNQPSKGNTHTAMNHSADGVILTFTGIKEKVKKHYTGMLTQNQATYQKA